MVEASTPNISPPIEADEKPEEDEDRKREDRVEERRLARLDKDRWLPDYRYNWYNQVLMGWHGPMPSPQRCVGRTSELTRVWALMKNHFRFQSESGQVVCALCVQLNRPV